MLILISYKRKNDSFIVKYQGSTINIQKIYVKKSKFTKKQL